MSSKYVNCPSYQELLLASEAMTPVAKRYYALMEKVKEEYSTGRYLADQVFMLSPGAPGAVPIVVEPVIVDPVDSIPEIEPEVADFFDSTSVHQAWVQERLAEQMEEIFPDDVELADEDAYYDSQVELKEAVEMIGVVVNDDLPISELLDLSDQPDEIDDLDLAHRIAQDGRSPDPGGNPPPDEKPGSGAHVAPTGLVNPGSYPDDFGDSFDPADLAELDDDGSEIQVD